VYRTVNAALVVRTPFASATRMQYEPLLIWPNAYCWPIAACVTMNPCIGEHPPVAATPTASAMKPTTGRGVRLCSVICISPVLATEKFLLTCPAGGSMSAKVSVVSSEGELTELHAASDTAQTSAASA